MRQIIVKEIFCNDPITKAWGQLSYPDENKTFVREFQLNTSTLGLAIRVNKEINICRYKKQQYIDQITRQEHLKYKEFYHKHLSTCNYWVST